MGTETVSSKEELVVICREFPKHGEHKKPITSVCKRDITPDDLNYFKFRGLYNNELQYYVCKFSPETTDEQIIASAKHKRFSEPYFIRL